MEDMGQGGNVYTAPDGNGYMPQGGNISLSKADEVRAARKHFSSLGLRFLAGTLLIFAVQTLAMEIGSRVAPELMSDMNYYLLVTMLPMYFIAIPILVLLVKRLPSQTPERRRMKPGHFVLSVIMAFALMYVANFIGTFITTFIGIIKGGEVENAIAGVVTEANQLTIFFIMVVCAPIVEELVFRKLVVDRTVFYGQGTAVVLSGLMFGLFHGNLNQFMYATALGMLLAFLYAKTGNLKITIAIHMLINLMGSIVSLQVLKLVDLEALMTMDSSDMQAVLKYFSENMAGLMVYMLYMFCVFGVMITGFVLVIVFAAKGRFACEKGSVCIPRGKRFRTVILNLGMVLYFLFWIVMIIKQLIA